MKISLSLIVYSRMAENKVKIPKALFYFILIYIFEIELITLNVH